MSIENKEDWQVCPSGTFERLRGELPAQTRQRSVAPYVGGFVIGAVVALTLFGFSLLSDSPRKMTCAEVVESLQDYHAQATDEETTQAIATHLAVCPECTARYEEVSRQLANRQWGQRAIALAAPSTLGLLIPFFCD